MTFSPEVSSWSYLELRLKGGKLGMSFEKLDASACAISDNEKAYVESQTKSA